MAIYSTFFLCAPERLPGGFRGWKLPLREPVIRKTFNPFTRKEMTTTTRAPEWDDADLDEAQRKHRVVAVSGRYEAFLEGRIPPFVQSLPHWCSKNLISIDLEPLLTATPGVDNPRLEPALYAHPSLSSSIDALPDEFVLGLCSADESELQSIAEKWAQSPPEFSPDLTVDNALDVLRPLAELARQRSGGQRMYLLTEA